MGGAVLNAAMIAWAQSQIEGIPAQHCAQIAEGLTWRWKGEAMSLTGGSGVCLVSDAQMPEALEDGPSGSRFVVSDGQRAYSGLPVAPDGADTTLLVFHDALPPQATDLTILQAEPALLAPVSQPDRSELLCFTPGTHILTEDGPMLVEEVGPGDRVLTRDHGPQEVTWVGLRRMTGARLFALPETRPIRIRQGALNGMGPFLDLLVSPDQRLLCRGRTARHLWGEEEVLIRARDMLGQPGVSVDHGLTGTYYINLLLDQHEVIWANGMQVESFHPGFAGVEGMTRDSHDSLLTFRPDLAQGLHRYGPPARRQLSRAEAELYFFGEGLRDRLRG